MNKKILILGCNGLIGNNILKFFKKKKNLSIYAASRKKLNKFLSIKNYYYPSLTKKSNFKFVKKIIVLTNPDFVINCTGITKHHDNKSKINQINIQFPEFLSMLQKKYKFINIHLSTDCVFSGSTGLYEENSNTDAQDTYGKTKAKIEKILLKKQNTIILRTSTIGHEISSRRGLLEWFLHKKGKVFGFQNAFFSGPTTLELAKIVYKYIVCKNIIKNDIYNISSTKISKYKLLKLIKIIYKKKSLIVPTSHIKLNRTLNNTKFLKLTNYRLPSWKKMILDMKNFNVK